MQVLITDNSILIIQRLSEFLSETKGIRALYQADNYLHALECFNNHKPDIVVLGINFPDRLSYRLLKAMKEAAPETVVITMAINVDDYVRQQCSRLGADFFLDKNNEFERIPIIINDVNNKRKVG